MTGVLKVDDIQDAGANSIVSSNGSGTLTFGSFSAPNITASTAILPDASDGAAIGSASLEWSDIFLADGAVINLGDDQDVTLTHVADTGIQLNSTMKLMFNDASQYIQGASATVLDIAATDEIELTATLIDVVGNLAGSGTGTFAGILKTDDSTDATSTTDGSLQTDGGLSVVKDIVAGDDIKLLSDAAVVHFGADSEITLTHTADTGLILKHTATADDKPVSLTLQTGETDMAANDVIGKIDFQAPDESTGTDAILVAAGIEAIAEGDFSSSNNATKLSFKTAASEAAAEKMSLSSAGTLNIGGDTDAAFGPLQIGNTSDNNAYIQMLGSVSGQIHFGDATSGDARSIGALQYRHDTDSMFLKTNSTTALQIDSSGKLSTGAEDSPDVDAGGITIDNNANDGFSLTFKNSDVAHATTGEAQADTFMRMAKYTNDGGSAIVGYSENKTGIYIQGHAPNGDTTKGGSSGSNIILKASKNSGSGGGNHGSNENLCTIANHNNPKFIFDAEGDFHADSSSTTFDAYDDAQLVRAYDLSHGRGVINSKFDKFVSYNHEKLADLKLVGREPDGSPNHFVNVNGMQRLHNGAIWQQYEKHNRLLEAVYELAKESIGEEKANLILEKHEVKRLN